MTTNPTNKPLHVLRDGALKATLWKNISGRGGEYLSVRITRTWRDDQGQYHDSDSFAGSELLRVTRLLQLAYDQTILERQSDTDVAE